MSHSKPFKELISELNWDSCFLCGAELHESDKTCIIYKTQLSAGGEHSIDNTTIAHIKCSQQRNNAYVNSKSKSQSLNDKNHVEVIHGVKIMKEYTPKNVNKPITHAEMNGCLGKTAWATEEGVKYSLYLTREKNLGYYKCRFCKKYHLGH